MAIRHYSDYPFYLYQSWCSLLLSRPFSSWRSLLHLHTSNNNRTWWPATCDKRPSTSDRGISFSESIAQLHTESCQTGTMSLPWRSTGPPPAPLHNFSCGGKKSKELSVDLLPINQIQSRLTIFLSGPVPMQNLSSRQRRTRIRRSTSRPRWISLISYRVVLRTALSFERCGATFTMFTRWRERIPLHFFPGSWTSIDKPNSRRARCSSSLIDSSMAAPTRRQRRS